MISIHLSLIDFLNSKRTMDATIKILHMQQKTGRTAIFRSVAWKCKKCDTKKVGIEFLADGDCRHLWRF